MFFAPKTITLKDGREAILRSPLPEQDAEDMCRYLVDTASETPYLAYYPEEWDGVTVAWEREKLQRFLEDPNMLMLVAEVDGRIAGNSQVAFKSRIKMSHRASVAIGLRQAYWNLGIGTAMFRELIETARQREGVLQLELEFIEGNSRARALYEKMGFRIVAIKPNNIRLKDGTLLNEYEMVKVL